MSNNHMIGEPDKFELSSVVTKNSRTGITSNRRLLVIKGGKLYYYSNIPKSFNGDLKALEIAHQLPKCSIDIVNIKNINEFDLNSPFFSIEFQSKHMMQKQDIRNSSMNADYNFAPRETAQEVTWQFTCDNQFIKKRWVSALKSLKDYYKEQDIKIQKFMQTIDNNHPVEDFKSSSYSSRSSIKMPVPWRESNFSRRSYNPDKGFEFKEGSPKESASRIQDLSFLKKGKSDRSLKPEDHEFEMVILEQPKKYKSQMNENHPPKAQKIQQVFKGVTTKNQIRDKKTISNAPLPKSLTIQQVSQQMSVPQTPVKEHNISYSDSDGFTEARQSVQKTVQPPISAYRSAESLSLSNHHYDSTKTKTLQLHRSYSIEVPGLPTVLQDRLELNNSKESIEILNRSKQSIQNQNRSKSASRSEAELRQCFEIGAKEPRGDFIKLTESENEDKQSSKYSREEDTVYRYEWLWGQSCNTNLTFEQRLATQKHLLSQILNFRQTAVESISSWLDSKARGQQRYPIIQENNRYLILQIGNILLKVALLTTQKIQINDTSKIFYNEDAIKNLKRQFKIHQNLFKTISKHIKTQPSLKLRVPLSVYIEYKGVCCIATRQHIQQQPLSSLEEDTWKHEYNLLMAEGYRAEWFSFKTVGRYLLLSIKAKGKNLPSDDESLKQYLKKVVLIGRKEKNHNLVFDPPISKAFLQIAQRQNASTSIQSLERYVKGLRVAKNLQGPCPKEEIIEALNYCIFCKQLRKIYRSAQGQIGETHFFNLVFKKDASMLNLLRQSDCHLPTQIHAQLFSFIEHYFGVMLEFDQKVFKQSFCSNVITSKKDLFVSSIVLPLVKQYSLEGFELVESYSKLSFYMQNKHPLARAALQKKKEIYRLSQNLPLNLYLQLLYDQASHLYYESDFTGCIKKCKEYESVCPPKSTSLFPLYLLMMKAYSQFSQPDFSSIFKKANEVVQLNYGPQNSCLINLYSLAAFYYQKLSQASTSGQSSRLREISMKLMKEADLLCNSLFGNGSKQYLDILLDSSRLHSKADVNVAVSYLQEAKKICQQHPSLLTSQNLISLLSYETELNLIRGLIAEAETSLTHALTLLQAKIPLKVKIHLFKLQNEVGFYCQKFQLSEEAIQRLWELGTYEKIQALQMAYKMAFRETGISQAENVIDENDSVRFQGFQRGLVCLDQQKQQFNSLVDMLMTAIEINNTRVLTLAYYMLHAD